MTPLMGTTTTISMSTTSQGMEGPSYTHDFQNLLGIPGYTTPKHARTRRGTWGEVREAEDPQGKKVAIKTLRPTADAQQQLTERELTLEKALRNESRDLVPSSHIVPARVEEHNGTLHLVMPWYEQTLAARVAQEREIQPPFDEFQQRHYDRAFFQPHERPEIAYAKHAEEQRRRWRKEQLPHYLQDIAQGLADVHTLLKRAHGDLKLDNIMVGPGGKLLLNDLGTSTRIINEEPSAGKRGDIHTRAPECWKGQKPTPRSDSWAYGALLFQLATGRNLLEKVINEPETFWQTTETATLQKMVDEEIRNLPRNLRGIARRTLRVNPEKRYQDGTALAEAVAQATTEGILGAAGKQTLRWGIPLTLAAGLTIGSYKLATTELTPPREPAATLTPVMGLDVPPGITFEREHGLGLPAPFYEAFAMPFSATERMRTLTSNQGTYLLINYTNTLNSAGAFSGLNGDKEEDRCTEAQVQLWKHHHGELPKNTYEIPRHWAIIANSINEALKSNITQDGTADLENVCTDALFGRERRLALQQAAGSSNYKDYRKGLTENEQAFLEQWLTQMR